MKKRILPYIAITILFIREMILVSSEGISQSHVLLIICLTAPIGFCVWYEIKKYREKQLPEKDKF